MSHSFSLLDTFEAQRPRLRAVAYRMLGSYVEAEDAVQEVWLRCADRDMSEVENLSAYFTTVVTRVCLNLLRSRRTRREESLESFTSDWLGAADHGQVPEAEAELADSVGLAMLVVLDRLKPAERVAFVLHDMFEVTFADIAQMMKRTAASVRQIARRARQKVQGTPVQGRSDVVQQQRAVQAYLRATRAGDFEALLTLLDPHVELYADADAVQGAKPVTLQGAVSVARSAVAAGDRARFTAVAMVDGVPALVMAPAGHLALVIQFHCTQGVISQIQITAETQFLRDRSITLFQDAISL